MPSRLKRYQQTRDLHFITFSCYHRLPLLQSARAKHVFEEALEQARRHYDFCVHGYVVMPEHVHLLVTEPQRGFLGTAIQAVKQSVSRKLIGEQKQFWQRRYYDFNVRSDAKRIEKLRYMHRNPVTRGLVQSPDQWKWSSFLQYKTGMEGLVEIESQWTARKRELAGLRLTVSAAPPYATEA